MIPPHRHGRDAKIRGLQRSLCAPVLCAVQWGRREIDGNPQTAELGGELLDAGRERLNQRSSRQMRQDQIMEAEDAVAVEVRPVHRITARERCRKLPPQPGPAEIAAPSRLRAGRARQAEPFGQSLEIGVGEQKHALQNRSITACTVSANVPKATGKPLRPWRRGRVRLRSQYQAHTLEPSVRITARLLRSYTAFRQHALDNEERAGQLRRWASGGFGRDDLVFEFAGDEHGRLVRVGGGPVDLRLGDVVRLLPSHCDTTVNLYSVYTVHRGSRVEAVWPVTAQGCSR